MPLPGISHEKNKVFLFIFILAFTTHINAFPQNRSLAVQEDKLAKLYAKMVSFYYVDIDSLDFYDRKFETDFKRFIKGNPGTINYTFKQLDGDSNFCQIKTSSDGNFRIYNWDTQNYGPMHYYKSIYQWKGNGRVFTNITDDGKEVDGGNVCSGIYTVMIGNKLYYLVIKNSVGAGRDRSESISAYSIEGENLLDTVKLFKIKTETLNSIIVNIDNFNVVDDYNQKEGIIYDEKLKIVSIPLVNDKRVLTNKYLLYQFKGRYFEYIGVETGWRNSKK